MEVLELVLAFLDENGYRRLAPVIAKNHSPDPGEYFVLTNNIPGTRINSDNNILSHVQVMTKHRRWDLTLAIYNDGLINIHINKRQSPDVLERVEMPSRKVINLCSPKSLEVLKRFL